MIHEILLSELRIGNWYNVANVMEGGKLYPEQFAAWSNYLDIEAYGQPIPLTPDILVKCGFKNVQGDFWMKVNELMLALDKGWWWTNSWEADGEFGFDALAPYKEIEHLHQLQNLYLALTGSELPVTL